MHTYEGFITSWICIVTLIITFAIVITAVVLTKKWLVKQKVINKHPVKIPYKK